MRRKLIAALSGAVIAAGVGSLPAAAAPPAVVFEEDFENTYASPAEEDPCGVDTTVHEVGSVKITEFYDDESNLARVRVRVTGTTTVTTEFGQIVDRWSQNRTIDPDALTETVTGNTYNVHAGPGGVLVNDSGRIVVDLAADEVLAINGPHQAWFGDFDDACAVLAP